MEVVTHVTHCQTLPTRNRLLSDLSDWILTSRLCLHCSLSLSLYRTSNFERRTLIFGLFLLCQPFSVLKLKKLKALAHLQVFFYKINLFYNGK